MDAVSGLRQDQAVSLRLHEEAGPFLKGGEQSGQW